MKKHSNLNAREFDRMKLQFENVLHHIKNQSDQIRTQSTICTKQSFNRTGGCEVRKNVYEDNCSAYYCSQFDQFSMNA